MTAGPPSPLRRFAELLDDGFRIPGTRIRFGLDPVIGLIPGVGDGVGAVMAMAVLLEAARAGVSRATILRIAWNVAVDALVGAVPVLGDLFDVAWKANTRNVELLERHLANPTGARQADRGFVILVAVALLLMFLAVLTGTVLLGTAILDLMAR